MNKDYIDKLERILAFKIRVEHPTCIECHQCDLVDHYGICEKCYIEDEQKALKGSKWSLMEEIKLMIFHPLAWIYIRIVGGHL